METLKEDDGSFDGEFQNGQLFKAVTCRQFDDNGWTWVMEGTDVHSDHLQKTVTVMTNTSKRAAGYLRTFPSSKIRHQEV
jgi:hypothetical protein